MAFHSRRGILSDQEAGCKVLMLRKRDLENEEQVFFTLEFLPEPYVCEDQLKS